MAPKPETKTKSDYEIKDVSDTALWVAYYRAKESERTDALFRDPLARKLIGERGQKIAENMGTMGRYAEWFANKESREKSRRLSGYMMLERA